MPQGRVVDLDFVATLRAAAPSQRQRQADASFVILPPDLRERVRETRAGTLMVFVVDASGSMGARRRMEATKGAILSLLIDAYQRRDRIALISFRGDGAHLLLPPTSSAERAYLVLAEIATGGRTPLAAGLQRAGQLIDTERRRDAKVIPLLVLISDGRSNIAASGLDPSEAALRAASTLRHAVTRALVIDTESGFVRLGLARSLAAALDADYVELGDAGAQGLAETVRRATRPMVR